MKKVLLLAILLLNLLPIMKNGRLTLGTATLSAQNMGNESGSNLYHCTDDDGFEYTSPWPCEEEPCITSCSICHQSMPCDELDGHMYVQHNDNDNRQDPDEDNDSDQGGIIGGGGGSTGGGSGGTIIVGPPSGGGGGGPANYWEEQGKQIFNKIQSDLKTNNVKYYKATIETQHNQKVATIIDNLSTAASYETFATTAIQTLTKLGNSSLYQAFSQSLAHMNIMVSGSHTAIILVDRGDDLSFGDMLMIIGDVSGIVAVYATYANPVGGALLGSGAAAVGMLGSYLNSQEVYIPLKDGRVLHLKPIEA